MTMMYDVIYAIEYICVFLLIIWFIGKYGGDENE